MTSEQEQTFPKNTSDAGSSPEKPSDALSSRQVVPDDPVRLYLKEIGRIDLLDSDHEFWLSARMKAQILLKELEKQCEDPPVSKTTLTTVSYTHLRAHET